LRSSAIDLRLQRSFNAYSATSSQLNFATASTTANAVNGTYDVDVVSVASSAKLNSATTINNTSGTPAKSSNLIGIATGTTESITVTYKNELGVDTLFQRS
jgi:flagellar hook-associated protein 2